MLEPVIIWKHPQETPKEPFLRNPWLHIKAEAQTLKVSLLSEGPYSSMQNPERVLRTPEKH